MSVTKSFRITKLRDAKEYQELGLKGSEKRARNKLEKTDRVAGMICDAGSPDEFVELGESLAETHGRTIEARSLIQSFPKDVVDPNDPEAMADMTETGYELGKRLAPNSPVMVISHDDSENGHPHNHLLVLNHDEETGKALQFNNMHYSVAAVNDQLMRDRGYPVVEKGLYKDQMSYWETRREGPKVTEWEQHLGDEIDDALYDPRSLDTPSYKKVLEEKGITLIEDPPRQIEAAADGTMPAHESIGWHYKMLDEIGEKKRYRQRKASGLSKDFDHKGAHVIFEYNEQERLKAHGGITGRERAADTRAEGRIESAGVGLLTSEEVSTIDSIDLSTKPDTPDRDAAGPHDDERLHGPEREAAEDRRDAGVAPEVDEDDLSPDAIRTAFEARREAAAAERARAAEGSSASTEGPASQQSAGEPAKRGDGKPVGPRRTHYRAPDRDRDEGRGLGD